MDFKKLGENIGLDEEEYMEMIEIFIESGQSDLEKLEAALRDGDAEKAHHASHSFKGAAGNMGLDSLFNLAKAIDDRDREGNLDGLSALLADLKKEFEILLSEYSRRKE